MQQHMKEITKYKNGNYDVTIFDDGTKIRSYENEAIPDFPESIDIKITNYCEINCKFCYEDSTTKGQHSNLESYHFLLEQLPGGTELKDHA